VSGKPDIGVLQCSRSPQSQFSQSASRFNHAKAVESDLEESTGVKPRVGFNWNNGRLISVTVAFPSIYEAKPLRELAETTRESVLRQFQQAPENIELTFSIGK
jgi:hypothetical protein